MGVLVGLVFCLAGFVPTPGAPVSLKCVTWNINGAEKLKTTESDRKLLAEFDVIFLQETYLGTPESVVDLDGYIPHHQLGRPTLRRYQWGLSTLMHITSFVGGSIRRIDCPVDWMIVSRWQRSTDVGLLMINVYFPAHSDGFSANDANAARAFIDSLRRDFNSDSFVIGGDLNVDRY
jgi:exonuclease III